MKKIILFDIDRTLIDTDQLKDQLFRHLTKLLNISFKEFEDAKIEYMKTLPTYQKGQKSSPDFDYKKFLQHMCQSCQADFKKVEGAFYQKDDIYRDALFTDTVSTLKALFQKRQLGIFSEGFPEYQVNKLTQSRILKYFDHDLSFIDRDKLTSEMFEKLPERVTIVDDHLPILEVISQKTSHLPIWLNRKNSQKDPQIKTIHTLKDLV